MKNKTRWILSVAAGAAAVPASYAASLLLCGPAPLVQLTGVASALTLIP
ncbi:MAG: hypothetical protein ACM30H_03615 [Clostridia bacterium]